MKNFRTKKLTGNNKNLRFFSAALFACCMLAFASCSRKVSFATSTVVPAAVGKVKIKKDGNDNYRISLNVEHLADPKRLQPARQYYVVWAQTDNDVLKNLGQLKSSTGFLSNTRKASMETVSPFKPNDIFITAEDEVDIPNPRGMVVLNTNKF